MKTIVLVCTVPDERMEISIAEAKKLGYRIIVCGDTFFKEYEEAADSFYTISFNDADALYEIALLNKADGIVGLCDKAMLLISEVCAKLKLPGNSIESMQALLSKDLFRILQEKAGVFHPRFIASDDFAVAGKCESLQFPLIVKPSQNSSSFGQRIINSTDELYDAFCQAKEISRNKMVCIEEYIDLPFFEGLELDIFLLGNEIIWDGIRKSYRTPKVKLRPIYDVYPAILSEEELEKIKSAVSAVLKEAGACIGEYNVEGVFTKKGEFFIIEINPRQAGYYNPVHIEYYCGINLTRLLLTTAVGDHSYFDEVKNMHKMKKNIIAFSVFSEKEGILDHIHVDSQLEKKIVDRRSPLRLKEGMQVDDIISAIRPIEIITFKFDSLDELKYAADRIESLVYAVLK